VSVFSDVNLAPYMRELDRIVKEMAAVANFPRLLDPLTTSAYVFAQTVPTTNPEQYR
jgi:hypothetical protein